MHSQCSQNRRSSCCDGLVIASRHAISPLNQGLCAVLRSALNGTGVSTAWKGLFPGDDEGTAMKEVLLQMQIVDEPNEAPAVVYEKK